MQKSSVNLGFYAKILQGTVSWQYDRAQKHWAFDDFDNHTISTTPNLYLQQICHNHHLLYLFACLILFISSTNDKYVIIIIIFFPHFLNLYLQQLCNHHHLLYLFAYLILFHLNPLQFPGADSLYLSPQRLVLCTRIAVNSS